METGNNAYAKFGVTNKEYYGIFRSGLLSSSPSLHFPSTSQVALAIVCSNLSYEDSLASAGSGTIVSLIAIQFVIINTAFVPSSHALEEL